MALPATGPSPPTGAGAIDFDNLLAPYRSMRAQPALFDVQPTVHGPGAGYDEFVDAAGDVRPSWQELADCVGERGRAGLDRLRAVVRSLVDNDGITYIQVDHNGDAITNGDGTGMPGPWQLDALPLVISAADWDTLEAGLVQRSRLLDAVLTDLYGARRSITGGVLPPQLLFAHPGYVRAARGIEVPGRHQLFLHGCDISRARSRRLRRQRRLDAGAVGRGLRAGRPTGGRHTRSRTSTSGSAPGPASPWAQALRLALIDAAPESAEEPVVVVLSPGIHSETAFDQAYLAERAGLPAGGECRPGGARRQAVDAVAGHPQTGRRGVAAGRCRVRRSARPAGRLAAGRRGPGRGAATRRSDGGQHARQWYPGKPWAASVSAGAGRERCSARRRCCETAPVYWGGIDVERSHLLTNLSSLLIKPVTGRRADRRPRTVGAPARSARRRASRPRRGSGWARNCRSSPRRQRDYLPGGLSSASVGMRLFTVAQRGGYAPMIGGLGYLLAPGTPPTG